MKKALQIGGIAAGLILIGFGIAAIVLGIKGGNTVNSNLSQEFITGTPDMTPSGIEPEVEGDPGRAAEARRRNRRKRTFLRRSSTPSPRWKRRAARSQASR